MDCEEQAAHTSDILAHLCITRAAGTQGVKERESFVMVDLIIDTMKNGLSMSFLFLKFLLTVIHMHAYCVAHGILN